MQVMLDFTGFDNELEEWAAAQNSSTETLIRTITLEQLRIFIKGKMVGQRQQYESIMEIMGKSAHGKQPPSGLHHMEKS